MSDNKPQFKRSWTIFDHKKLDIMGDEWKDAKGRPKACFLVHENNPRFRVYMNDDRKNNSPIPFKLDPLMVGEIAQVLRMLVANKKPDRHTLELKHTWDHKGVKTDKPAVVAKIHVGRDSDLAIYIAFHAKEEPLAKFTLLPSYYGEWTDASNEKFSKETASEIRAMAYANFLEQFMYTYMIVHGKEPKEQPYKGGGGGNDRKSGSWSKSNETADSNWEDDHGF